jgi:hypothetical protein
MVFNVMAQETNHDLNLLKNKHNKHETRFLLEESILNCKTRTLLRATSNWFSQQSRWASARVDYSGFIDDNERAVRYIHVKIDH